MEGGRQAGAEDSSLGGDRRTENPTSCVPFSCPPHPLILPNPLLPCSALSLVLSHFLASRSCQQDEGA